MTPERWSQVEELFESVIARAPAERAAWLDRICADDETLRREVEALLAADENAEEDGAWEEIASGVAAGWAAENEGDELIGQTLGRYEVLSVLGAGGMGQVYCARDTALDRKVALKLLPPQFTRDRDRLRRFEREARAASALDHPNIVPVYETGECEGQHYFTMRLVPGGQTIAHWAAQHREDYRAIAGAAAKVARAVAHAHERGILHRDLKPSNILWDSAGEPQVTDFGLAKVLAVTDVLLTFSGQALGSPSYMAPEQMGDRNAEITTATDVYGMGAVLYELLAARPPFAANTALETMRRATDEAPQPIPKGPKDLRTICLKCLEKKPADRYRSAAALADDLERFVRGEPVSAVPLTPPQVLWRWAARNPRVATLLALFLLSLLVGVAGITWQWRRTEAARAGQAKTLAHLDWQEMARWARTGEEAKALAYLASQIRQRPDNWSAAMYAMSIVDRRSMPMRAGPPIHPPSPFIPGTSALAPDGSWFVAAGEDGIVRAWETTTGRPVAQFPTGAPVTALAVSGGPIKFAFATKDGGLALSSAVKAEPVTVARSEGSEITALQFSGDGSALLGRSAKTLEVWSTPQPNEPPRAFTLDNEIEGAEISADGTRVLAWNAISAVVWETSTGRELLRVSSAKKLARGTLSANGARVAFVEGGYFARVWDVASGRKFPLNEDSSQLLTSLALDPTGVHLTIAAGSKMFVRDVASGFVVSPPMEHHYAILGLRPTPDAKRMISTGWDGAINLWDAHTGLSLMSSIEVGGSTEKAEISPSRDGSMLLVHLAPKSDRPESLAVWRGTRPREPALRVVPGEADFDAGRISPDGRLGALGMLPGNRSYVYDLESGKVLLDHSLAGGVYVHLFSPDMRKCYALTVNGWLYGWSLETGEELWPPNHQSGSIHPAAISADGSRIIVGHSDGHIRVHDAVTGALVQTLDHPGDIRVLRFAPDGSGRFVSASLDGMARVWDLGSGRELQTLAGHTGVIISAAWSPDSRYLATASFDNTARVWDVATGHPVGKPMQHLSWLSHLEFSPDGELLATA
ncbi:MAG TPA: protein kinase, partial [Chthoniobacterales bacterium]|nr:protein kinase [Chthoniobacterales bacterium]